MPGVLYLCNVLQFIIHRFYDSPLSEQEFVRDAHQCSFHVAFQLGNKLYAINEKPLEEPLADIPLVTDQLAMYKLYKGFVFQRLTVINVTWCNHEVEKFSSLVAYQMQLEPKEPSHRAFPSLGNALENLMNVYSLVSADAKRRAVNKTDACAFSQQDLFDKQSQWDGDFPFQFYETVVRDYLGKQMT